MIARRVGASEMAIEHSEMNIKIKLTDMSADFKITRSGDACIAKGISELK